MRADIQPRDYLAGSTQSTHSVTAMRADIQSPRLSCWIHPVYSLSHGHAGRYSTPEIILLDPPSLLTQSRPCGPIFNPRDYLAGSTQSTHSVTAMRADIQPPRLSCWIHPVYSLSHGHAGRYSTPEIILLDPPSLLTQSRPCGPIFNPRDYLAGSTQSTHSVTAMRADIQPPVTAMRAHIQPRHGHAGPYQPPRLSCWIHPVYSLSHGHAGRYSTPRHGHAGPYSTPEIILLDPPSLLTQSRPCGPIFNPPRLSCWIHPVYSPSHGHAGRYSTPEIILLDPPSLLTQSRPCGPIFNPRDYLAGFTQSTHSVTPCGPIFNPRDYLAGSTQSTHSVTAMRADIQPPRLSCWIHPVYSLSHGHAGRYSTPCHGHAGRYSTLRDYLAGSTQSTHSVTAMRADIQPRHGHAGPYSTPEIILLDPPSLLTQSRPCGPIFNPRDYLAGSTQSTHLVTAMRADIQPPVTAMRADIQPSEIILLDPPSLLTQSRPCGPIFKPPRLSCWIHPVYSLSHGHAGRYSTLRDYLAGSTQSTHLVTAMRAHIQPPRLSCWIHPVYSLSHGHAGR